MPFYTETDKTDLTASISSANVEVSKFNLYTLASRTALQKAIDNATVVLNNKNATTKEVASAIDQINTAMSSLVLYTSEDDINKLLTQAGTIVKNEDKYTKDSLDKVNSALDTLNKAIESDDKEAIEAAYKSLNEAIAALEEVKEDEQKPSTTPSTQTPSGSTPTTKPADKISPKTGDSAKIAEMFMLCMLSAGGIFFVIKNKKETN